MSPDQPSANRGEAGFSAGGRFSALPDDDEEGGKLDRALLLARVARDARLDRKFLLLVLLSAAIATLGLLQSSTAVVIGAMLVSPLLGPIMGIGFGLATLEAGLIKRSLVTLAAGIAVAVLVAMVIVWLSPIADVTPELRARTQPTLLDLGVAVVGGIAGVFAIMRGLSGVMVGVAIATALVPPLSTVGFGLATWRLEFATGAGLLFLTNTLAIALAATLVARLNHFGPYLTPQHTAMQMVGSLTVIGLLSIPLALSLNSIAAEVRARSVVQAELRGLMGEDDRIDTLTVRAEAEAISIDGVVIVDRYSPTLPRRLSAMVSKKLDREARVSIVQLRQQTDAAVQVEERLQNRIAALENRDGSIRAIAAGLMTGGLIARDQLVIDRQARRVIVARDRAAEGDEVAAAMDRIMAAVQSDHPDWLIQSGEMEAAATGTN
ncbi:MAG: DUF389 domain-containing protein [Sphingopyxis sp.]|nr:DUF389 domain-containing protein [Sphingopyxis sp.]